MDIPAPHRRRDVSVLVFAAHHEADLARRVGGDGGVGVFDHGEDFPAGLFEVGDEREVEPLVFSCDGCQLYISRKRKSKRKRERERREKISAIAEGRGRTTLGRDNPAFPQRSMQQLKVWLLEQAFRRTLRIAAVRDDDVEFVLLVRQELEPVTYVCGDVWVLEAQTHAR